MELVVITFKSAQIGCPITKKKLLALYNIL